MFGMPSAEDCASHERFTRFDAAIRAGDMEALRAELGDEPGFPNVAAHPAIGLCLVYAIYHSPLAFVRELLEAGADPNVHENDGYPPLIAAFDREPHDDLHELLELLIEHGADVEIHGVNDYTPLHLAAAQGDLRAVDILLAHGADADTTTRIDDVETPLEVAAAAGHQKVVDRLKPLTTRLDWERASQLGDVRTLKRMLQAGYDIDKRDGFGQTALMRAAHRGHRQAVELLIAQGANLDHTAKFNLSALMLSVLAGHPEIARVLAKAGADPSIEGRGGPGFRGKTAADLAMDKGDRRLAAYLSKA